MKITTLFGSTPSRDRRTLARRISLLFALIFAGCSILPKAVEDPTRYYLLAGAPHADQAPAAPKGSLHVGIRAVDLPIYLRNTRSLVVRTGVNELRYQDFARWAEPLDLAVQHAVRNRLLASEAVAGAETTPFSTEVQRDFDVIVRVVQCEGGIDSQGRKTGQFSATYEIVDVRHPEHPAVRKAFSGPVTEWDGQDFGALAARLSDGAAALGDDIAASLPK